MYISNIKNTGDLLEGYAQIIRGILKITLHAKKFIERGIGSLSVKAWFTKLGLNH